MVTVEQVKYWHVYAGIGHVVATNYGDGWLDLACRVTCCAGTGSVTEDRPARICRKCREALKDA